MPIQTQHLRLMVVDLDGDANAELVDPMMCDFLAQCEDFTLHDLMSAPDGSVTLHMDTGSYGESSQGSRVSHQSNRLDNALVTIKFFELFEIYYSFPQICSAILSVESVASPRAPLEFQVRVIYLM